MPNSIKQTAGYIVSNVILSKEGRFTLTEIIETVEQQLANYFETYENLCSYVKEKINSMCELGLIGKTEIYYFAN